MKEDIEIFLATSSMTRDCFSCGSKIQHRTIIVKGFSQEITFHESCFDSFLVLASIWKDKK